MAIYFIEKWLNTVQVLPKETGRNWNGTGSQECKKSAVFLKQQHFYPWNLPYQQILPMGADRNDTKHDKKNFLSRVKLINYSC